MVRGEIVLYSDMPFPTGGKENTQAVYGDGLINIRQIVSNQMEQQHDNIPNSQTYPCKPSYIFGVAPP